MISWYQLGSSSLYQEQYIIVMGTRKVHVQVHLWLWIKQLINQTCTCIIPLQHWMLKRYYTCDIVHGAIMMTSVAISGCSAFVRLVVSIKRLLSVESTPLSQFDSPQLRDQETPVSTLTLPINLFLWELDEHPSPITHSDASEETVFLSYCLL